LLILFCKDHNKALFVSCLADDNSQPMHFKTSTSKSKRAHIHPKKLENLKKMEMYMPADQRLYNNKNAITNSGNNDTNNKNDIINTSKTVSIIRRNNNKDQPATQSTTTTVSYFYYTQLLN